MGTSFFDIIEQLIKGIFKIFIFITYPLRWVFKELLISIRNLNVLLNDENKKLNISNKIKFDRKRRYKKNNEI